MTDAEFFKRLKEIDPTWKPIEERTSEEQEEAYDRMFDWEEDE